MIYLNKQKRISKELDDVYWFQEGPGVRNWQFTHSGIKLLNVANISKNGTIELEKTDRYLSEEEVKSKYQRFLVDEGDLVIASSGISIDDDGLLRTRGAFIYREHLPLCMNTSTIRFKGKEGISDLHFLKFWLDSYEFRDQITKLVTGSAQQNFGPSHLKSIKITLPSPSEQKRTATVLEKADRLRRLRRYELELSDTYLQSMFLEMFGDPVTNPKKWDLDELGKVCKDIYRYPTFYGFPYTESGTPVVRIGNILPHGYLNPNLNDYVFIDPNMSKKFPRTILELHDIVMAVRGDGSTVSRIGLLNSQNLIGANMSPNLLLFRVRKDVLDPLYLFILMTSTSGQSLLESYVTRTAKKTITAEDIKQIKIPIPSRSVQEKFVCIAQKFERLQIQQREALRQAEHLFQTLLHKAFQSELSLGEDEELIPDMEIVHQRMPVFADVIEPINTGDAFQLALPME